MGFGRTLGHNVKAHNVAARLNLNSSQANKLASTCKMILLKFDPNQRKERLIASDIIEESLRWEEEAQGYFTAIAGCPKYIHSMIQRSCVIGIALHTFRYLPAKSAEFWSAVCSGQGNRNAPTRRLHMALADYAMDRTGLVRDALVMRTIASAWGSFIKDEECKALRPYSMDKPLRILRVPIEAM